MANRRCILLTVLMFCFIFIGLFFGCLHRLRPPAKHLIKQRRQSDKHRRPVDTTSLVLNKNIARSLYKGHKLKPMKSRDATIFVGESGFIQVPPDNILDMMKFRDLEELYDRYLGSIQKVCSRKLYLGTVGSGGYDVCEDANVIPSSVTKKPCILYSFVSKDDLAFENDMVDMYNCEVHVFNQGEAPSNPPGEADQSEEETASSSPITIHPISKYKKGKLGNIEEIKSYLGHEQQKVQMLKLDIHGDEWNTLAEFIPGTTVQDVKQLFVRFHTFKVEENSDGSDDGSDVSVNHRTSLDYRRHLALLRSLYARGFRIFHHRRVSDERCVFIDEFNISRTGCHEVSMMKI